MKASLLRRRINDFSRARLARCFDEQSTEKFRQYLVTLGDAQIAPPRRRDRHFDWRKISNESGVSFALIKTNKAELRSGLVAVSQAARTARWIAEKEKKRLPDVEHPIAISNEWEEPRSFAHALEIHMQRHRDTIASLLRAVHVKGEKFDRQTLKNWLKGLYLPRHLRTKAILKLIEDRYKLPIGYFQKIIHRISQIEEQPKLQTLPRRDLEQYLWHMPQDFSERSPEEQSEILQWIEQVIIRGATQYRRYQAKHIQVPYSLQIPRSFIKISPIAGDPRVDYKDCDRPLPPSMSFPYKAPPSLLAELAAILRFKTSVLTALGYCRNGRWGKDSAVRQIKQFSLFFGALAAPRESEIKGLGIPLDHLTIGIFVFPALWDWYLRWREERRGFFTSSEEQLLIICIGLTRARAGWLRQTPAIAEQLKPIPGLISEEDIRAAQANWDSACDRAYQYADTHLRDVRRVSRVHRDTFEAIAPVLEAKSPVGEYRKIADEITKRLPDGARHPLERAEHIRALLMLRLALHLGLRQKNLRQLMFCPRGSTPTPESQLANIKRGELRWNEMEDSWEVFVPLSAFKNGRSSFFNGRPYRLILPDVADLYQLIEEYSQRHRGRLLGETKDPQTLFVRTFIRRRRNPEYSQATFYNEWRNMTARFGVYNPYTGRGAISGLLPHGPHNVRDVLATHILKKTGSYELASYAVHDTPAMIVKSYGRFHPRDKIALATNILNEVWAPSI